MKKIQFLALGLLFPLLINAQGQRLKYADKQYQEMSYLFAAEAYEDVLERGIDSMVVAEKIADSYLRVNNVPKAVQWFDYIKKNNSLNQKNHLQSAIVRRQLGQYEESNNLLNSYVEKFGHNDITQNYLNAGQELEKLMAENDNFKLQELSFNTIESEISPAFISDNELLITSSRKKQAAINRVYDRTMSYYYNLYKADIDSNGTVSNLRLLGGEVNTKFHDASGIYDQNTGFVYFTRNNFHERKKGRDENNVMRLKIYRGKLNGDNVEGVEELPFNNDNFSCGHPTLSQDGKTLYFSSDMPGGLGGTDIYRVSIKDDGSWGTPENLGASVNTSKDELFPYFHPVDEVLFFSSNGHFGLGGLDVFVAKFDKKKNVKKVENLGAPINSPYDDFSFVNNKDQKLGYVSTNRIDDGGLRDDVFSFNQAKRITNSGQFNGKIINKFTEEELTDILVMLEDKDGNIKDTLRSDENGDFIFVLTDIDEDFNIVAKNKGFLTNRAKIEFDDSKEEYNENINLVPELAYQISALLLDRDSQEALEDVKITLKDKNKNDEVLGVYNSNNEGTFLSDILEYIYMDSIDVDLHFEKEGYVGKSMNLKAILAENEKVLAGRKKIQNEDGTITYEETESLFLDKVELGKDLAGAGGLNTIYFDLNSSFIRPDASKELDKIVTLMKDNPGISIELGSHTDSRGRSKYNRWLSERRAKSSVAYIVSKGIDASRITGKGYGDTKLKVSDKEIEKAKSEEEKEKLHEMNRRTEFIIVKVN